LNGFNQIAQPTILLFVSLGASHPLPSSHLPVTTPPHPDPIDMPPISPLSILSSYYSSLGYRVHSGLQFGCELVLYSDDPSKVHSDFAIMFQEANDSIDWRRVQCLARAMPDLHKKLIISQIIPNDPGLPDIQKSSNPTIQAWQTLTGYTVSELRLANFHRSFKVRKAEKGVGEQVKNKKRKAVPAKFKEKEEEKWKGKGKVEDVKEAKEPKD
jgi:hypothetical protein